ncbi:MAG: SGNH/GDSL hydrolase family protein [Chitinophagaceae bacterium]|nr:SGNH/GDSL hydrolase family protein [Chitinophagaceae bacterium]
MRKYFSLKTISYALNIFFILLTMFIVYKFYPKIKSIYFPDKIEQASNQLTNHQFIDTISTIYYDASTFEHIGQLPNTKTYTRLPESAKENVPKPIWFLSKSSSGISILFSSNTSKIKIRWTLLDNTRSNFMSPITTKGLDLYAFKDNKWQFVGIAKPSGTLHNEATIILGMENEQREYLLNLPMFDGLDKLEIGIDQGATIGKPQKQLIDVSSPIVFYGTSITQGGAASRPGLAYTSLLERHFNKEVINLGFSSNGKFEKEIAAYIMTAKPSMIILDCTPNSASKVIQKNLPETIDYIKSINDSIPIILIESIIRDYAYFTKQDKNICGTMPYTNEQNNTLKSIFENKIKSYKNIFYISNQQLIGKDHEATIDGTHFNDLGHYRTYEYLRNELKNIIEKTQQ